MTTILHITPEEPSDDAIAQAVDFLRDGQVIAYPTETIYGLGADVLSRKGVKRVYELKARDVGLPISILVSDVAMLRDYVSEVSDRALSLIHRFWPGPLTILFPASSKIEKGLLTNTGRIGIRISSHPVATALVKQLGHPITTTSANPSGFPPSLTVKHISNYFGARLPCIIDGGECEPTRGSTVVDIGDDSMRIVREGAISASEVIHCFQRE